MLISLRSIQNLLVKLSLDKSILDRSNPFFFFVGLCTPDVSFQHSDDLAVRYSKLKSCVQEFTIIQYGVCAFKKNPDTGDYIAKPFNFYIFGADTHQVQSRRIFSATPSSLSFLRSNKFDFNKLIEQGIPFYNYSEESSMFQSNQGTNVVNRRSVISGKKITVNFCSKLLLLTLFYFMNRGFSH